MKKFTAVLIFLILINTFIPLLYSKLRDIGDFFPLNQGVKAQKTEADKDTVTLLNSATGRTEKIPLEDFLIGSAACEMPASYESEAIKAQMVAAYTYYRYCLAHPDYLPSEYITFDESKMQTYASKTALTGYWGTRFYDYYAKFERCARRVLGEIVAYENEPALTVYHAVSCGKTRSSRRRWGTRLSYLEGVDSPRDAVSDDYLQIKEMSPEDVSGILKTSFPGVDTDGRKPEEWFGDISYTESGYADFVSAGKDKIPADQFREAFNLPSSCLMIFFEDGQFSFVTKGYGHGVGMSQFGANRLSQQGYDYKKILEYYYPGTTVTKE